MKQFVHAILSAAALVTISGCITTPEENFMRLKDPLRIEIEKDIDGRIQRFQSNIIAEEECVFSSELAKEMFNRIPAVAQQKKIGTLAYDMESLDGRLKVSYIFASGRRMKFVVKDNSGKILYIQLLNGDAAYSSKDGIEYNRITLPEHINELQLNYDMTMLFALKAKKVTLVDYEMKEAGKVTREPLEHNMDGQRCWKFDVELGNKNYAALVSVFISADEKMHQISNQVTPIMGLAKDPITVKCSRFVEQDGFVFPGFITTDSKDAPQLTLKKFTINKAYSELEFIPDMLR